VKETEELEAINVSIEMGAKVERDTRVG